MPFWKQRSELCSSPQKLLGVASAIGRNAALELSELSFSGWSFAIVAKAALAAGGLVAGADAAAIPSFTIFSSPMLLSNVLLVSLTRPSPPNQLVPLATPELR